MCVNLYHDFIKLSLWLHTKNTKHPHAYVYMLILYIVSLKLMTIYRWQSVDRLLWEVGVQWGMTLYRLDTPKVMTSFPATVDHTK